MYISQIFSGECTICLVGFALHFFKNIIRNFGYIKLLFIILIGRIQNICFRCTRVRCIRISYTRIRYTCVRYTYVRYIFTCIFWYIRRRFIIRLFLMIFNEFSARKCDDKQRCHGCDYYICVSFHIGFMPFILFEAFLISIVIMIFFIYNMHC